MQSQPFSRLLSRLGFTLVELLTVVAIIAILAAIAIPSYMKYVKSARTSEATANLAAIQSFEESYFSENDTYLSVAANPSTFPTGTTQIFSATYDQWPNLGRVIADGRSVYFQYRVTAGSVNSSSVYSTTTINHSVAACTAVGTGGNNFSSVSPASLGVSSVASTYWFVATAMGDQDRDNSCSLFVAVTDRPDITKENEIE